MLLARNYVYLGIIYQMRGCSDVIVFMIRSLSYICLFIAMCFLRIGDVFIVSLYHVLVSYYLNKFT